MTSPGVCVCVLYVLCKLRSRSIALIGSSVTQLSLNWLQGSASEPPQLGFCALRPQYPSSPASSTGALQVACTPLPRGARRLRCFDLEAASASRSPQLSGEARRRNFVVLLCPATLRAARRLPRRSRADPCLAAERRTLSCAWQTCLRLIRSATTLSARLSSSRARSPRRST